MLVKSNTRSRVFNISILTFLGYTKKSMKKTVRIGFADKVITYLLVEKYL